MLDRFRLFVIKSPLTLQGEESGRAVAKSGPRAKLGRLGGHPVSYDAEFEFHFAEPEECRE